MISALIMPIALPALLFIWLPIKKLSIQQKSLLIIGLCIVCWVPISSINIAGYVRAVSGDISMVSLCWLLSACFTQFTNTPLISSTDRIRNAGVVTLLALILYPATLGLTQTDPYAWGYAPTVLLGCIAALCVGLWWLNIQHLALWIALAVLGFSVNAMESTNLWDYLIDPWIGMLAIGICVKDLKRRFST